MSRYPASTLVTWVAFGLSGIAAPAAAPAAVEAGNGLPIVSFGFSPRALPKDKPAHMAMNISLRRPAAVPPPALHEVVLELDRNIAVDAKGMATCRPGTVESPPPPQRCQSASVGSGEIEVEVAFPEQAPFIVKSKLFAFNGGTSGGKTTILTYAYLGPPMSAAVVTTVKTSKIHRGRFGTKWVEVIPKIAGGYGSIKSLNLSIDRRYRDEGEMKSYLLGRCTNGQLDARATSVFADASAWIESFVRSCSPR
jgi:hypothetical protein